MVTAKLLSVSTLLSVAWAAGNSGSSSSGQDPNGLTLLSDLVQTGSEVNGLNSLGAEAGEAASQTSNNNFINYCQGQTLTNGLQIVAGSCNGIPMGKLPAKTTMISTVILNPVNGQTIGSGTTFNITVQVNNLQAGAFTDADATYYGAPQDLNGQGQVIGHTHVTVQDVGNSLNPTKPPDPTQFAFFKGINDAGNGAGQLSAEVTGGLPPGNYRVCTLTSAANHQPVIMPVAQRGSQDDCRYFVVNGNNDTINAAANDGSKGIAAADTAASAVALGPGALVSSSADAANGTTAAASATSAASDAQATGKGGKGGNGGAKEKATTTTTTTSAVSKASGGSGNGGAKEKATTTSATAKTTGGGGNHQHFGGGAGSKDSGGKRDCGSAKRQARRRHYVA